MILDNVKLAERITQLEIDLRELATRISNLEITFANRLEPHDAKQSQDDSWRRTER